MERGAKQQFQGAEKRDRIHFGGSWPGAWCRVVPAWREGHGGGRRRFSRNHQPLFPKHEPWPCCSASATREPDGTSVSSMRYLQLRSGLSELRVMLIPGK